MVRGRKQIEDAPNPKAAKRKPEKQEQFPNINVPPEGSETLVALADKRVDTASERGRLGKELQETDEALLAEMHQLGLKTWTRDGITIVIADSKERVKVTREGDGSASENGDGGGEAEADDGEVN